MSPTFSYGRGGKLYRYYVSAPLQQGARRDPSDTAIRRISAPPLEANLAAVLRRVIPGCPDDPITLVSRAELHDRTLHCLLPIDRIVAIRERLEPHERVEPDPVDARLARLHLPLVRRRGETWVLKGPSAGPYAGNPGNGSARRARTYNATRIPRASLSIGFPKEPNDGRHRE